MAIRFRIGTLLIITALVALFMGFFAPELRSWDRYTRLFSTGIGIITAVVLVSFTPVWVVMLHLRRRSRQGLRIRAYDYAAVVAAFLSSFGIFVAFLCAIRWMVVR